MNACPMARKVLGQQELWLLWFTFEPGQFALTRIDRIKVLPFGRPPFDLQSSHPRPLERTGPDCRVGRVEPCPPIADHPDVEVNSPAFVPLFVSRSEFRRWLDSGL